MVLKWGTDSLPVRLCSCSLQFVRHDRDAEHEWDRWPDCFLRRDTRLLSVRGCRTPPLPPLHPAAAGQLAARSMGCSDRQETKRRACRHSSSRRVDLHAVITAQMRYGICCRWQHSLFSFSPCAAFHLGFPRRQQTLSSSSACQGVQTWL